MVCVYRVRGRLGDTPPVSKGSCLAALVAAILLGGCGDDGPSSAPRPPEPPARLSAQERAAADRSVGTIRAYCRDRARSLAGEGRARPALDEALAAARRRAALARAKPAAPYRGSQTARNLAADLAEDLEGSNCSNTLVAELARGLRTNRFP